MVKEVWKYDVLREGDEAIIRFDCQHMLRTPSIEDDPLFMSKAVDVLAETEKATKIVFFQKRDFEYDYEQTQILLEIARLSTNLVKQKDYFGLNALSLDGKCKRNTELRYNIIHGTIFRLLKEDPIGCYIELKRIIRNERINLDKTADNIEAEGLKKYISLLMYVLTKLERTRLITLALPHVHGYKVGMREGYREILRPIIKPDFMFTKLMSQYPMGGEEIDNYKVGGDEDVEVTLFQFPETVKYLYHVLPPEFKLSEEEYDLLDMARTVMAEHKPSKEEFVNPKRMRDVFFHVGHDLIEEVTDYKNMKLSPKMIDLLTNILVRYTVGFGLVEVLLMDEKI